MADPTVNMSMSEAMKLLNTGGGIASDIGNIISNWGSNAITGAANTNAINSINQGVGTANAAVTNALTAASGYAQPYINAGTSVLPAYQNALANQGMPDERISQLYGAVSSQYDPYTQAGGTGITYQNQAADYIANMASGEDYYNKVAAKYAPYTAAGAEAAGMQVGAIRDLQNLGSAMDYYNQVRPMYAQNIEAGQNMLSPAQQLALRTAGGFSYGDFQNTGEYQALENANTQAQRALEAQSAAAGMFGSGTMANALGSRMQENYANYFGQAQQADLQTKQAAAQQFQALISQGLTAQQAANTVANQMMSNDVNKNQAVISSLNAVANQGLSAENSAQQNALNWVASDLNRANSYAGIGSNLANIGLQGQNAAVTNTMALGNQQLAQQAQQMNSLYNAANMGNVTAQNLMNQYMTGAQITGQNTLAGAQAQAAAQLAQGKSTAGAVTGTTNALANLINNPNVMNALKQGATWAQKLWESATSGGYEGADPFDDLQSVIDSGDTTALDEFQRMYGLTDSELDGMLKDF